MKTFRELISWELEQDKHQTRRLNITTEDSSEKLASSTMRKLRYLSAGASGTKSASTFKRA